MKRTCSICGVTKSIELFYFRKLVGRLGHRKECKECSDEVKQRWYRNNFERLSKEGREKYAKDPHKYRDSSLRWRYGITQDDYDKKLAEQKGTCAICKQPKLRHKDRVLAVDHCHASGKFRGILCTKCNTGIGLFGDDIIRLEDAIKYLKENK